MGMDPADSGQRPVLQRQLAISGCSQQRQCQLAQRKRQCQHQCLCHMLETLQGCDSVCGPRCTAGPRGRPRHSHSRAAAAPLEPNSGGTLAEQRQYFRYGHVQASASGPRQAEQS